MLMTTQSSSVRDHQSQSDLLRDPLRAWKNLLFFPIPKLTDAFSLSMKAAIAVFSFASLSILLLFISGSFNSQLLSCPQYDQIRVLPRSALGLYYSSDAVTKEEAPVTNISHILFGIGGSAKTWSERRHYSELWWQPNVTKGFVWLDEDPPSLPGIASWPDTSPPYRVSADTSRFQYTCWYGTRSAVRIARIVKESFELGLENVRWFVMGDDDTVFFTENLLEVLRKYDHNEMYYIGGNSESVEQDQVHSYAMAYGGGGFAISWPLAAELVRVLDGCIDRYHWMYGSDQKVQGCLSEIGVPLTKELGFHQVDIRGNPYGLLAAHPLAPLVSLHHLDYVKPLFPNLDPIGSLKKLRSSYELDPSRTLQHSFCHDIDRNWSISISWGYTVRLYPSLLNAKELDATMLTFQSWRSWKDEPFTFDTRPMSPNQCERALVYFLDDAHAVEEDGTLTTYKKHGDEETKECNRPEYVNAAKVKQFNVSALKFDPNLWKKAPRRQCCEVINGRDASDEVVQVRIRRCNPRRA